RLPMPLPVETTMEVDRGIEIGLDLVVTDRAAEQLAPALLHAASGTEREPLTLRTTAGTILTGPMRIELHRHRFVDIRFFFGQVVDLPPQLIRLLAVQPPRLAASFGQDPAQSLEEQHTARKLGTDLGDGARCLVGHVPILPFEVPIAMLI